jgi:type I restriction enzyme R subunit
MIARFKKPLVHKDPPKQDGLAFLCVKSMLLTGFDAPVEGVMYLDRPMKGHEMLQAIARVNRPYANKSRGLVVDYVGVGRHLAEALAAFDRNDIEGAMENLLRDELPRLEERHKRAVDVFRSRGVNNLADREACVQILGDLRVRGEFSVKLKAFLNSLDAVLPRPEALPYVKDAQLLGRINVEARNRYRDEDLVVVGAGPKVEELIDQHLRTQGIDAKVPPIALTATDFFEVVDSHTSSRAKASEMEHAARHHLRVHMAEDPVHYRKLSERLEGILDRFEDDWDRLAEELRLYAEELREPGPADVQGLDPQRQAPFFRLLVEGVGDTAAAAKLADLAHLTVALIGEISKEIGKVDFWRNPHLREDLQSFVRTYLDDHEVVPWEKQEEMASRIVELAKALHTRLTAHE